MPEKGKQQLCTFFTLDVFGYNIWFGCTVEIQRFNAPRSCCIATRWFIVGRWNQVDRAHADDLGGSYRYQLTPAWIFYLLITSIYCRNNHPILSFLRKFYEHFNVP